MYFLIPHNTSEVCIICAYIVLGFLSLAAIIAYFALARGLGLGDSATSDLVLPGCSMASDTTSGSIQSNADSDPTVPLQSQQAGAAEG